MLDVGCGNGRFASFLAQSLCERFDYLGIDASEGLLARARARQLGAGRARFRRADWALSTPERALPPQSFSLVVTDRLGAELGLERLAAYCADGQCGGLNCYLVLRARP